MTVSRDTIAAIRFGYGFHPAQGAPRDAADLLAGLRDAHAAEPAFPLAPRENLAAMFEKEIAARKANDRPAIKEARKAMRLQAVRQGTGRLVQKALSQHGFYERLAAFWADHFTVARRSARHLALIPYFEPDTIRPHLMGRFADMLTAVAQHPVMLVYLDQITSRGPNSAGGARKGRGLNENLAREILELHTLGVGGGYTQKDVREFAELLTGYAGRPRELTFRFVEGWAEPGAETVLGRTYGGGAPSADHAVELFQDLARHPSTAKHLARKLAVHFVADQPDEDLVRHIANAWRKTEGHLPTVYQAMLEHPSAWRNFGRKVKRPEDLVISTLRAAGVDRAMAKRLQKKNGIQIMRALRSMNQPMFNPPGPDGWPEEASAWITPQGLAGRLTYAAQVGQLLAKSKKVDPRRFAETTLRGALRPATMFAVGGAPDRWEGIALTLASPEFNRR